MRTYYGDMVILTREQKLEHVRAHAVTIRELLERPFPRSNNVMIWRALFVLDNHVASGKIIRQEGQPTIAEITRRVQQFQGAASQQLSNASGLQAEEIAVFFGLDEVEPSELCWVQQDLTPHSGLVIVQEPLRKTRND